MSAIEFPNMFNTSNTKIVTDSHSATIQNLKLLLTSEKGELFGDPFFGIRLKKYVYNQNNYVLRDILIDEIYSQILVFMPQLIVMRKDIKIEQEKNKLTLKIKATNKVDFTTNMYELALFDDEER